MRFSSHTLVITYIMAALGLCASGLVESIGRPFIAVIGSAVSISLVFNIKKKELIPGLLWNVFAGGVLMFFAADYFFLSMSLITSASRFLAVLLSLKLFDLKRARDYLLVYSIVFFQILAAAASTVSPAFFAVLSLFIVSAIWAMIVFNIRRDFQRECPDSKEVPLSFGTPFFLSITGISAASILMTLALFFLIPRMGVGFFDRKTGNALKVTGFSDKVDIGAIGNVKKDPTVIMRVEIKTKSREPFYFRGASLDFYDGRSWSKRVKEERLLRKGADGRFALRRPPGGRLIEQNIVLEPLDTEVIFAGPNPVFIEGAFQSLWVDSSGSMHLPSPPYSKIEYRAWSATGPSQSPADNPVPAFLDTSYMDSALSGGRMKNLAKSITRGALTDMDKARAIENYLKDNYTYSLETVKGGGENPLEAFLFHTREGYCEHYATAMAMLLRYCAIPSRMVTGFLEGEWNSYGKYWIVRQQDAHSWVEAYIRGEGWVTFDPTPSTGTAAPKKPSALALYLDLLKWRWDRYIIHFTFNDQRNIAMSIEGGTSGFAGRLRNLRPDELLKKDYVPSALLVAGLLGLVWALIGRTKMRYKSNIPVYYEEMLKELKKKGITRKDHETPLEFASRLANPRVDEITSAYHIERYGGIPRIGKELERIKKALAEIKGG